MSAEFPLGLEWVNVERPVALEDLRGRVVILFFWTYSSSQCRRLAPILRELLVEHDQSLAVIGIHCPKFPHERDPRNLRHALNRQFVRFPVASDPDFSAWHRFGVEGWPSCAVLDAEGQPRAMLQGSAVGGELERQVTSLVEEAIRGDLLQPGPARQIELSGNRTPLRYPGGLALARGHLYVSDTAHNQVLELELGGRVLRCFGSGRQGFWDGQGDHCGFDSPQGLAYGDDFLYVADSGNHAIRRINLLTAEVETVVGNGRDVVQMTHGTPRLRDSGVPLPSGIAFDGPILYIASAGLGQIWRLDLGRGTLGWFAGTGQSGVVDGEALQAAFAQPQGVAISRGMVYVADADGSALREVRAQTGYVQTRIGQNPFTFGCEDGPGSEAMLQFPMGLAVANGGRELWIADTLNDRLRLYNPDNGRLTTPELDYAFSEPAAVAAVDGELYVANTNAHEIVHVDLATAHCEPLEIIREQ